MFNRKINDKAGTNRKIEIRINEIRVEKLRCKNYGFLPVRTDLTTDFLYPKCIN